MTKFQMLMLVIFQLKHFFADYPLQRPWMLGKFKPGVGFVIPLAAHCFVHAALTWAIAMFVKPEIALPLAAFDFGTHFVMDRVKASPKLMGRWKPLSQKEYIAAAPWKGLVGSVPKAVTDNARDMLRGNRLFWDALGFDQMVHHLTHYAIIWFLLRGTH